MKCILLAAGYATRLYPLTVNKPKPLLEVAGKTILQHILEKIEVLDAVNHIYIVTNQKFYCAFCDWVNYYNCSKKITVINDHTTTNENRLGAIADLQYAIKQECIDDDILVMAGDNLFTFDLRDFLKFYDTVKHDCITTHELSSIEELKRTGVIEVDGNNRVVSFEEKPEVPKSKLAVPPFYIYNKETIPLIGQYLLEGNNKDAPGNFIPWLIGKKDVYAFKFQGERYDIGNMESYKHAQEIFRAKE